MKFVSFHSHDTHSHADAIGPTEVHVKRVADLGMWALGTSNHGNVNNHAQMEQWCKEYGIKPIYGCEVYYAPVDEENKSIKKTHLTIFAMNEVGYRNLNRIVTQSFIDSYKWPTVSWENLCEHNEGIAVLSGCADSLISCTLLGGKYLGDQRNHVTESDMDAARAQIQRYVDVFGDRFYLEVQRFPKFNRTCTLNPAISQLSRDTGVSLIATADVHYPFPEQNKIQAMLHAARWKNSPGFAAETSWEHHTNLSYPLTDDEIVGDLQATGLDSADAWRAVQTTSVLAGLCTVELPKAKPLRFSPPNGLDSKTYMRKQISLGWRRRCSQRPDLVKRKADYMARIGHEWRAILDKGFVDYFLVIADLTKRAKDRSTDVGPARGSAAASLIAYLLGITEIDPLHPLFNRMEFSRFIDPNRSDPPDIDLDFDDGKRFETEQDARAIYGNENVASVANHTAYRGKSTLKDVCRAYHLSLKTFEAIGKRCAVRVETDERVDDSIKDVLESYKAHPEIAKLIETYPIQLQQAMALEGNQHSMGIHACGYVIASDPIPDVCAIYTKTKGTGRNRTTVQVIPYEKRDAEYVGLLKADFLGSTTMGAIGLMRKWSRVELDELYVLIYKEYDRWVRIQERIKGAPTKRHGFTANTFDNVLARFRDDDVTGIMQFEGGTTRQVTRAVQPVDFDELAACTALSRPGPYYGGQFKDYVAVKNGEMDWKRIHPDGFDRHVEWTYGQIVYQEQIMWILRDLAGFENKEVLRVRKIIGKKLGEFQFEKIWEAFKNGCATTCGVSEDDALRVFSSIRTAAGYAFNTGHAYSYALIAWWQQWFKMRYTTEFFAATLAKNGDGKDEIPRRTALLQDCEAHRIGIGGWDLNFSEANWRPHYYTNMPNRYMGMVMPGFCQIPGIAEATAADIIDWRVNLPWSDIPTADDWAVLALDKAKGGCSGIGDITAEKIAAFVSKPDALGVNRTADQLSAFRKQLCAGAFDNTGLPDAIDEYADSNDLPGMTSCAFVGLVGNIVYRDEIETIRNKTGLDIETIRNQLDDPEKSKKATIFAYDEHGEIALRISRWQYPRLAGKLEAIKTDHHIIVVWGKTYEYNANSIQVKNLWVLDPD
jgi:DNA polymerase-3 subunit alpha